MVFFSFLCALVHIFPCPNKCVMCVCMTVGVCAPDRVCFLLVLSLIAGQGVPPDNKSTNIEV